MTLFFEGMPSDFWRACAIVQELGPGDVMLVVGTSGAVAPACLLPFVAMSNGAFVVEVNLERCLADDLPPPPAGSSGAGPATIKRLLIAVARVVNPF